MVHHRPMSKKRRSIRLPAYDYAQAGGYFITICTHNRACLFGENIEGKMVLNDMGLTIECEWAKTPALRSNVKLDVFVVMPNHIHGIVLILESARKGVSPYVPAGDFRSPSQTIGAVIRGFKSAATKQINIIRNSPGTKLWQRNFYERVIRNEDELSLMQKYIVENPAQWEFDKENLNRGPSVLAS